MEQMHSQPDQAHSPEAEASARLKYFKEYAISHPLLQQVDKQLTRAMDEPAGFAYVLLPGPSGVGKTTMIRQIEHRHLGRETSSLVAWSASFSGQQLPCLPMLVM